MAVGRRFYTTDWRNAGVGGSLLTAGAHTIFNNDILLAIISANDTQTILEPVSTETWTKVNQLNHNGWTTAIFWTRWQNGGDSSWWFESFGGSDGERGGILLCLTGVNSGTLNPIHRLVYSDNVNNADFICNSMTPTLSGNYIIAHGLYGVAAGGSAWTSPVVYPGTNPALSRMSDFSGSTIAIQTFGGVQSTAEAYDRDWHSDLAPAVSQITSISIGAIDAAPPETPPTFCFRRRPKLDFPDPHQILFMDTFNGPDYQNLMQRTPEIGSGWWTLGEMYTTRCMYGYAQLFGATSLAAAVTINSIGPDCWAQAILKQMSVRHFYIGKITGDYWTDFVGLKLTFDNCYIVYIDTTSNVNVSETILWTRDIAPTVDKTYKIVYVGNNIRVYEDNILMTSITNSSGQSSSQIVIMSAPSIDWMDFTMIDNFEAGTNSR